MKAVLLIAAALFAHPGYSAELMDSVNKFCLAIREANYSNIPGNPSSPLGLSIQRNSGSTALSYREMWDLAKSTGLHSCSQMW